MRYKMKIEASYECSHCLANTTETLQHIYLDCPKTQHFYETVKRFINNKIDEDFNGDKLYQFTCCHENVAISYLYLTANWYVGQKMQYGKQLYWDEFKKYLKILQVGEKTAISSVLGNLLT